MGLQHTETNLHSVVCEPHHPNMICDLADDQSCSTEGAEPTSKKGDYDSLTNSDRHRRPGGYGLSYITNLMSSVKVVIYGIDEFQKMLCELALMYSPLL